MSFLLDTNVVSEWMKPRPNLGVVAWVEVIGEDRLFLSSISVLELRFGIDRLPAGKKRAGLDRWLREELVPRFDGRILPIDATVAEEGGRIMAICEAAGRRIQAADALLAATARLNRLTLVTRNEADFGVALDAVHNPWT